MNTENLPRLFRSRRFWSWFAGSLVAFLIVLVPSLEGQEELLLGIIEKMTITLISAYGLQDIVTAWRNGSTVSGELLEPIMHKVMTDTPEVTSK